VPPASNFAAGDLLFAALILLRRWQVFVMSRLARDPNFQVHGVVLVGNFDSVKLADAKFMARQLRHGRLRLMMHYITACAPARIGGIYIVNQPKFIGLVWGLMSLFMGKKVRTRVHFLGKNLQVSTNYGSDALLPMFSACMVHTRSHCSQQPEVACYHKVVVQH
jgi:hypothetical protein